MEPIVVFFGLVCSCLGIILFINCDIPNIEDEQETPLHTQHTHQHHIRTHHINYRHRHSSY